MKLIAHVFFILSFFIFLNLYVLGFDENLLDNYILYLFANSIIPCVYVYMVWERKREAVYERLSELSILLVGLWMLLVEVLLAPELYSNLMGVSLFVLAVSLYRLVFLEEVDEGVGFIDELDEKSELAKILFVYCRVVILVMILLGVYCLIFGPWVWR